jgi:hypothetical protein
MRKPTLFAAVLIAVSGGSLVGLLAWQSALPKVGLTQKDVEAWATESINEATDATGDWEVPGVSASASAAIQAMTPDQRAALVRDVLALVKTYVMSPAFRAAHTARIKEKHQAVDHGIDVNSFGPGVDPAKETVTLVAVSTVQMLRMQSDDALRQIFENQRAELAETIKTETGEDKANAQKFLTKLNAVAPLMKSNPAEFKKAFTLAVSANMGGPATEEAFQAASVSGDQKQKLRDEQAHWNQRNLNVILKRILPQAADELSKVDFKLATRIDGADIVFVDRLQDMGGPLTQMAYRFGPGPTQVAIAFIRAWIKEL